MLLVDKDSNVLDDKKEAAVTILLSEHKSLTTEKYTTINEVHKRTETFTTSEEVVKGTDQVQKCTENITQISILTKGLKNWKI